MSISSAYSEYYAKERFTPKLYPVEFVVRTLLGSYPNLSLDKKNFVGKRILDLGYGDGRNMCLLTDLGFDVFGVELTDEINLTAQDRFSVLGISPELRKGENSSIPFEDNYFDYLLACHSCYYVSEGQSFTDNINEISRVLKSNGLLICSLPFNDTYILKDAEKLSDNHYRIKHDPYGLRENTIFKAFANELEIEKELSPYFKDFRIGFCNDNFYGIHQKVWIVTCSKK